MQRIVFAFILTVAAVVPSTSRAGTPLFSVEPQLYVLDAGKTDVLMPEVELFVAYDITPRFGVYSFSLVNEAPELKIGWAETQFGPTFWVADGLQVGVGLGLEQDDAPVRGAAFVFVDPTVFHGFSLLAVGEYGGSGAFYTSHGGYAIARWFRFGAMAERFSGTGPRADVRIPGTPLKIWTAGLRDLEADSWSVVTSVGFDCLGTSFCAK